MQLFVQIKCQALANYKFLWSPSRIFSANYDHLKTPFMQSGYMVWYGNLLYVIECGNLTFLPKQDHLTGKNLSK